MNHNELTTQSPSMGHCNDRSANVLQSRWTVLCLCAAVVALGAYALGLTAGTDQQIPREITAQNFVLRDAEGNVRGLLGIGKNGEPALRLWNEKEDMALTCEIDHAGMPRLGFDREKGDPLLEAGVLDGKFPVFMMKGPNGSRRIGMMVTEQDHVAIILYDAKQRMRGTFEVQGDGNSLITLRDKEDQARAALALTAGCSALSLRNPQDQERIIFQVNQDGHADGIIFERDGTPKWRSATSSTKGE